MELRAYWDIIWRRAWIIVLVLGVVSLYAGYQYYKLHKTPGELKTYQSEVTLLIGLQSTPKAPDLNYPDYISASESLADAYATGPVLTFPEFDQQVVQQIHSDMGAITSRYGTNVDLGNLDPSAVGAALSAARAHALVTVSVTWPQEAGAWAIARAVGEVSVAHIGTYVDYVISNDPLHTIPGITLQPPVTARVVSDAISPIVIPGPSATRGNLLLLLPVVALVLGLALAFLIEYLDDRIQRKEDVEQLLQLPVYGEVPHPPTPGKSTTRRTV